MNSLLRRQAKIFFSVRRVGLFVTAKFSNNFLHSLYFNSCSPVTHPTRHPIVAQTPTCRWTSVRRFREQGPSKMTLSLEIKPELEDRPLARAQSLGQPLELFIQRLLETEAEAQDASAAPVLTGLEKAAALEAWAKSFPPNLPNLPLESIPRENIYRRD